MRFVAAKATEQHPPIYHIFRTASRGRKLIDWPRGARSMLSKWQDVAPEGGDDQLVHLEQQVVSAVSQAAASLSPAKELAVTVTLTANASTSETVHVLAEPFPAAPNERCVAAVAPPQPPPPPDAARDLWRCSGWLTPGVHPALPVSALPSGAEELLLLRDDATADDDESESIGGERTFVEGASSNLMVLQEGEADGELGLTICTGGYIGATARALNARRATCVARQTSEAGWKTGAAFRSTLASCLARQAHADERGLREGRWHGAWLLCKLRGARRLTAVLGADGTVHRLDAGGEAAGSVDRLVQNWLAAEWRERAVSLERIGRNQGGTTLYDS